MAVQNRRAEILLLALILLIGAWFRLSALGDVPPGLTHDEANNLYDAAQTLAGDVRLYYPQGKEPIYDWSAALLMAFFGAGAFALRLTSALWSLAAIPAAWALIRRLFGAKAALMAAGLIAVSFWPVMVERAGLRAVSLAAPSAAALYVGWRAVRPHSGPRRARDFALAGLAFGFCYYTYLANLTLPAIFIIWIGYLFLTRPALRNRRLIGGLIVWAMVYAAVIAPLLLHQLGHPEGFVRIWELREPFAEASGGNFSDLWGRVARSLGVFFVPGMGDSFQPYNIPGKPLLDPVTGALFVIGLVIALWRWKRPACALSVIALVIGFFPAATTGPLAANLRAVIIVPFVYALPARAVREIGRWAQRVRPEAARIAVGAAAIGIALVGVAARYEYFGVWANDPHTRAHGHLHLIAIGDDVRDRAPEAAVISAQYPEFRHDPVVVRSALETAATRIKYVHGARALVFPTTSDALLFVPDALAPFDDALMQWVTPVSEVLTPIELRPNDTNPRVSVYRWLSPAAYDVAAQSLRLDPPASYNDPEGEGAAALIGAGEIAEAKPGGTVTVQTLWMIWAGTGREMKMFVHITPRSDAGDVLAQEDRLDFPSWNWEPTDAFLQIHRVTLPPDLAPGRYAVRVGLYDAKTGDRWAVEQGGTLRSAALIGEVEVR